jgi:hypothetical protein
MANGQRDIDVRQKAQAMWEKKKGPEPSSEREKEQKASEAKVARLRELRLAKEAAEREAAQHAKPVRRKSRS